MPINIDDYGKQFLKDYENGDFEVVLTKYRKKKIIELCKNLYTGSMCEIGCGMEPFFTCYNTFNEMVVVEPAKIMYESAVSYAKKIEPNRNIVVFNDFIENVTVSLAAKYTFDVVLCVGLLHEVDNPFVLLQSVYDLCSEHTHVILTTNNPCSFHILLGKEMGLVSDITEISAKARTFQRKKLYTADMVKDMLEKKGFFIEDSGSYFVKPFTHGQMKTLMETGIMTESMLDGLDAMIKYMPNLGSENYWVIKK